MDKTALSKPHFESTPEAITFESRNTRVRDPELTSIDESNAYE
jgi:hypothetical protein